MMSFCISLRCVRRSNEVGECQRGRAHDVILTVILKPKSLVDSIITGVGRMRKVKVYQIMTIHHTRRIEGHRGIKSHTNQPPLASITGANVNGR